MGRKPRPRLRTSYNVELFDKKNESQQPQQEPSMGIWQRTWADIRRRVITGIITLIPITITILILYYIIKKIYQLFSPLVNSVFFIDIPVVDKIIPVLLSIILAASLLYLIGTLSATIAIRRLITFGEKIVARIPIIKILYLTTKQFTDKKISYEN